MSNKAPSFEGDVDAVFKEARGILIGRHQDYGPHNIGHAWPDPTTALIVRVGDKLERLRNLHGNDNVFGERARDSWIDLCNYSAIAVMVADGTWPNE